MPALKFHVYKTNGQLYRDLADRDVLSTYLPAMFQCFRIHLDVSREASVLWSLKYRSPLAVHINLAVRHHSQWGSPWGQTLITELLHECFSVIAVKDRGTKYSWRHVYIHHWLVYFHFCHTLRGYHNGGYCGPREGKVYQTRSNMNESIISPLKNPLFLSFCG